MTCKIDTSLESFIPRLRADLYKLESEYETNGETTWSAFSPEFGVAFDATGAPTAAFTFSTPTVTLTDGGATFVVGMIGKYINIKGATSYGNNGLFVVTGVPSSTTIEYTNANGVAEAQGSATYAIGYDPAADLVGRVAEKKKVINLTQADFALGTLRITHPCKLVLTEDILFNPNAGVPLAGPAINPARTLNWNPDPSVVASNAQYFIGDYAKGYRLGFFAAIAIEAEGVILDLNGYSIRFHPEFNLMQRFGSILELSDQPFRTQQGPGEFGGVIRSARKVWVKNGILGDAHHNCHGNSNNDVLFTDVIYENHEVASMSLNGGKRILVESFEDRGTKKDIPVLGTFSALRFAIEFAERADLEFGAGTVDAVLVGGGNALTNAKAAVNRIFNDVIYNNAGEIDASLATGVPGHAAFKNLKKTGGVTDDGTGIIDGPSYGMLFHPEGVAIGPFLDNLKDRGMETSCIVLKKGKINDCQGRIVEVPAVLLSNGAVRMIDPTAAVIQFLNTYLDDDANPVGLMNPDGTYAGTIISNLQIAMARVKENNPGWMSGFLFVDPAIVTWAIDGTTHLVLEVNGTSGENQMRLTDGVDAGTIFPIDYGGDGMHHLVKGMTALRMDGVNDALIKDVIIADAASKGALGEGSYINAADGGNPAQLHNGYLGCRVTGARLSSCQNIAMVNVSMFTLESYNGEAVGIEVAGESNNIQIVSPRIKDVLAGTQLTAAKPAELKELTGYPNRAPLANAILVHATCNNVCMDDVETDNIVSYSGLQMSNGPVTVNSES